MKKIIKKIVLKIYHGLKSILARPIKQKTYDAWLSKGYIFNPHVSFIIQTHNKSKQVTKIIKKLRNYRSGEIIVIDDGSKFKHVNKLRKELTGANEFLIVANDLYELITYDRAINLAKGRYVCLMQDDDDFKNIDWIEEAINFFSKYKDMVILGGNNGITYLDYEKTKDGLIGKYISDGDIGSRKNLFKFKIQTMKNRGEFKFVECVNRAPMWINRKLFLEKLFNFDMSFSPYLHDDAEICLRAWLTGLKVGIYNAFFFHGKLDKGGMRIWNNNLTEQQSIKNSRKINQLYETKFSIIEEKVSKANSQNNL